MKEQTQHAQDGSETPPMPQGDGDSGTTEGAPAETGGEGEPDEA